MSRRQARTIGFGVLSSALAAWLASRIGVEFAIATGAAIVVLTSLTFELEVLKRALKKMPPPRPEDLPSGLRLHSDGTVS